ncbi:MAG: Stealth CR1 domain-containing protein [Muribaculaceae bacterium]|nr:Stealth CR1 domain-containing protein [Muribaculaceae bacterium]
MEKRDEIDFVVTWVNMDDPEWQKTFAKYSGKPDIERNGVSDARFRDSGFLRYWFRGVEKFAPWVRKIHFITTGQVPEWLDTANPKLNLVAHKDFIPEKFLPTFNSTVIERYMYRIPGLSDRFVYFNDDFYIIRPTPPQRFFQNGLPCDIAVFQYNPGWSQWYKKLKNNIRLINRNFDKKEVMDKWRDKWFSPLYGSKVRMNRVLRPYGKFITLRVPHNAQPYLKSTFDEVWKAEGEELTRTSNFRFRDSKDYSPELFRTWQICEGNFTPYNTYNDTKMFPLMVRPKQAIKAIRTQEYSLICLNDNVNIKNYEQLMEEIRAAFESVLPEKSSFEAE